MKKFVLYLLTVLISASVLCAQRSIEILEENFFDSINKNAIELAEMYLNQWRDADPDNPELTLAEAMLAMRTDSLSTGSGVAMFEKLLTDYPHQMNYRFSFIKELICAENVPAAIKTIRKLYSEINDGEQFYWYDKNIPSDSTEIYASYFLSSILDRVCDDVSPEVIEEYADSIGTCLPGTDVETVTRYTAGLKLYDLGRTRAAIEQCSAAAPMLDEPYKSQAYFNIALFNTQKDNRIKIYEYLNKAIDTPEDWLRERIIELTEEFRTYPVSYRYYSMTLLPKVAMDNVPNTESAALLSSPQKVISKLADDGFVSDRDLSAIEAFQVTNDSTNAIVWKMPEPEDMIECLYVAFVPAENHWRFITLEKTLNFSDSDENMFILCECQYEPEYGEYLHRNYSLTFNDSISPEEVANLASQIVRKDVDALLSSQGGKVNITQDFLDSMKTQE